MDALVVDGSGEGAGLRGALVRAGFETIAVTRAADAARRVAEAPPDLVLLDIGAGRWNWPGLLPHLRASGAPVLLLAGAPDEDDAVRAFDLGAVDYLVKPVGARELVARIHARLRGAGAGSGVPHPAAPSVLCVGPLTLDPAEHAVTLAGRPVSLTATEFGVLHLLMQRAGTVVRPAEVLRAVWGYSDPGGTDVVRQVVFRLRRKLGDDAGRPRLLRTIPGVGLLLKPAEAPLPCPEPAG